MGLVYDNELIVVANIFRPTSETLALGELKMYAFNLYFACGIFIGTLGLMGLDYLPRKK